MDIQINRQSRIPVYLQIADQIEHLVVAGRLQPGERLPAMRQLAADLGVHRHTVAHAYEELAKEEIIYTRQGRGSFISEQPDRLPLAQMRHEKLGSIFSQSFVEALSLGYSMPEIEEMVIQQLTRWWTETQNPNPSRRGKDG